MLKSYNIKGTIKDSNGTIKKVVTEGGMKKTVKQAVQDINNGYSVNVVDNHNHKTKVIAVDNSHLRTVPNKNKCDNLGDL